MKKKKKKKKKNSVMTYPLKLDFRKRLFLYWKPLMINEFKFHCGGIILIRRKNLAGSASGKELPVNSGDIRDPGSTLDWEDPLEEGMEDPLQYYCLKNPMTEEPASYTTGFQRIKQD